MGPIISKRVIISGLGSNGTSTIKVYYAEGHPSYTGATADTQRNDTGQTGTEYTNRLSVYHFDAVLGLLGVELTGPCEIHLDTEAGAFYADFTGVGTADNPIRATYAPVNVVTVNGVAPALQTVATVTNRVTSNTDQVNGSAAAAAAAQLFWDGALLDAGTSQAGTATTITLKAGANANDDFYKNAVIVLTGGTGAKQNRKITGYVGATKVATISGDRNWVTNPASDTTYVILGDVN